VRADRVIDRDVLVADRVGLRPCSVGARADRKRCDARADTVERPAQIDGGRPGCVERRVSARERGIAGIAIECERQPVAPTAPISGAPRTIILRIAIAAASASAIFTLTTACGNAR